METIKIMLRFNAATARDIFKHKTMIVKIERRKVSKLEDSNNNCNNT